MKIHHILENIAGVDLHRFNLISCLLALDIWKCTVEAVVIT